MKHYILLSFTAAFLLISTAALADAQRPANLECEDLSGRLGVFHVRDIDQGETGFWIDRDARGAGIETRGRTTVFYANNGCDNSFELRLATRALRGLSTGRIHGILGRLIYFDADTSYDFPGQEYIRTTVECRLYQPPSLQ